MTMPLQITHTGYAENCKTVVVSPSAGKQIHVFEVSAKNATGGAIAMGILKRLSLDKVSFYKIIAADTPDATVANGIKDGTATKIFTTTNDDGFLVQCDEKFSVVGLNVSTAAIGGTFTIEYFNGTAYTTLTPVAVPAAYGAGTQLLAFMSPIDWVAGTTDGVGGETDKYSILVRASVAPGGDVSADDIWVCRSMEFNAGVPDKGELLLKFPDDKPFVFAAEEGIQPYFGGSANANNTMRVVYQVQD